MKKIGIFYSFNTKKTALVAKKIIDKFTKDEIEAVNVENLDEESLTKYDNMIIGSSTWFDGELPNYWDEFVPAMEDLDLKEKKIALFGLGDQKDYPENFGDAIGILAKILEKCGAEIIGETSAEGYDFEHSAALKDGKFVGLMLDQDNQKDKTDKRIDQWVKDIKKKFK